MSTFKSDGDEDYNFMGNMEASLFRNSLYEQKRELFSFIFQDQW
jgi:hypothetical protein